MKNTISNQELEAIYETYFDDITEMDEGELESCYVMQVKSLRLILIYDRTERSLSFDFDGEGMWGDYSAEWKSMSLYDKIMNINIKSVEYEIYSFEQFKEIAYGVLRDIFIKQSIHN